MLNLPTENRKLPAWIGSILFHSVVLLLVLFWFSLSPNTKSGIEGKRSAIGDIVFKSQFKAKQESTNSPADADTAPADAVFSQQFVKPVAVVQPPTPAMTEGHPAPNTHGTEAVSDLFEILRGVSNQTGGGNAAGDATFSFFGEEAKGKKFVFVLDRSASMQGIYIQKAKEELVRCFGSLSDHHQFNIIFYNGYWQLWRPGRRLEFATSANKENAVRFIMGITAEGSTGHFAPLKEAIALRPDAIIFLTDGEANDDLSSVELRDIEQRNSWTTINVTQFGRGGILDPESRSLRQLAENNGGKYRYVNVSTWR